MHTRVSESPDRAVPLDRLAAAIFDLDGVITQTASLHNRAWQEMFQTYLDSCAEREGTTYPPYDPDQDYPHYIDGKPRYDGVRSFLASRDITLPDGELDDPPEAETVCGLGNRKNTVFNHLLETDGVEVYDSSIELLHQLRAIGMRTAIVSSSKNTAPVLAAAGIEHLFDTVVDGKLAEQRGLPGKPAPDTFLEAAKTLGVDPARAAVFEDAISGVEAGHAGGFAMVVGVDRLHHPDDLRAAGASLVVDDLAALLLPTERDTGDLPHAVDSIALIEHRIAGKDVAIFLDYDGTLTPIVATPDQAVLDPATRTAIEDLSKVCLVAIVSGRDTRNVQGMVGIDSLIYAGSHGFDIAGPDGFSLQHEVGEQFLPSVDAAEKELRATLEGIEGALVERKKYAIATHFRLVAPDKVDFVTDTVHAVHARHTDLRVTGGKKILELRPNVEWDKGKAVSWLLKALKLDGENVVPFFFGDDTTDEDAFRELRGIGLGIVVRDEPHQTQAHFALNDTGEVKTFLDALTKILKGRTA